MSNLVSKEERGNVATLGVDVFLPVRDMLESVPPRHVEDHDTSLEEGGEGTSDQL